jgi:hypothetical protein
MARLKQRADGAYYILQPFTMGGADECRTFAVSEVGEDFFRLMGYRENTQIDRRVFFALYHDGAISPSGSAGDGCSFAEVPHEWHTDTFVTRAFDHRAVLKQAEMTRRFNMLDAAKLVADAMGHQHRSPEGESAAELAAKLYLTVKWRDCSRRTGSPTWQV